MRIIGRGHPSTCEWLYYMLIRETIGDDDDNGHAQIGYCHDELEKKMLLWRQIRVLYYFIRVLMRWYIVSPIK